ncbi:MAG: phosphatase PAP2 family protein [Dehalococcoidia bacterium]
MNPGCYTKRKKIMVLGIIWVAFQVALLAHSELRGLGDNFAPHRDLSTVEATLFGGSPPAWLQTHAPDSLRYWLDFGGFMNHAFWFAFPLILGFAVTRKAPHQLGPYFLWIVTVSVLADLVFVVIPVSPPWMHEGVARTLTDRSFGHYVNVDDNQFAAFPSMHAALPATLGFFFLLRTPEARKLAWLSFGYALSVGISVVYLGEHWLLDVLGGYALACVTAFLLWHPGLLRLYSKLPGDPMGRMERINRGLMPAPEAPEVIPFPTPEAVPEAA